MLRALAGLYSRAFTGLSRTVWLLAAASLVNRSGTMVLPFLALYFTERRGFSAVQAGQMLALYGFGAMVASYVGGRLCDFVAPRRVMIACLLGTAAGFLVLGQLETRAAIAPMIVLLSLAGEGFRPANSMAIAAASAPGALAQSFSLYRLALNLGMSIGPALGGVLARRGYGWLFVVDAATCLLAAGVLWRFHPAPPPTIAAASPTPLPPVAVIPRANGATTQAERPPSPWRDPVFLGFLVMMTILSTVFLQLTGTFMLTLRSYGFAEPKIGLAIGVNALLIVLFEMALVQAARGLPPFKIVALGSFLVCAGFALMPLLRTFGRLVAGVAVWSLGEMLTMPMMGAVAAGRGPAGSRGRYQGLYSLSVALSFMLAPLVGTWTYQRFGPTVLWQACGVAGVLLPCGFLALAAIEGREGREGHEGRAASARPGRG